MAEEPGLTLRAVVAGCVLGAVLAVQNVYLGLKTGSWDSGTLTAAILGFAGVATLSRARRYHARENNITQTTSSAASAMPATVGLLGAVPALSMMGFSFSSWALVGWGIGLGVLGVLWAVALRRRLLVDQALPFPTGTAVAEVISAMHAEGRLAIARARALLYGALGTAALVWFRDGKPTLIPDAVWWPRAIRGTPGQALGLGVSVSPMMFFVGALVGPMIASSMLAGAIASWAIVVPRLLASGVIASPDYPVVIGWVMWPGVGLMVGASLVALVEQGRAGWRALGDLRSLGSTGGAWRQLVLVGVAALALLAVIGWVAFGVAPHLLAVALLLSLPIAAVCTRAAGETDIVPLGPMGQLTQALFGVLAPGRAVVNIAAAQVVAGEPAQTAQTMESFKTGQLLGASPREQVVAALVGLVVGAVVCLPVYALLVHAYGIGTPAMPAPPALVWKSIAELLTQGRSAVPPHALGASLIALAVGCLLAAVARGKLRDRVPSAVAIGIGVIIPANYSITLFLGAVAFTAFRWKRRELAERYGQTVAAGAIAGESLTGVLVAVLAAAGILH
jgi:uncharacterized oligopeptide transporter (OPT) family protein